ncbi:MAG: hypothetical protein GX131_06145 [candidate division WS1 bacterium]|nr:hypothetical protein [candidate division WS1 bacterium]
MRTMAIALAAASLLLMTAPLMAQDLPLEDFSLQIGFEDGEDPVRFWVANGEYEVNFKGVTDEAAAEGTRSFKLDMTINSGSYFYWDIPVQIPSEGELSFSGRIRAGEGNTATAGLGLNWVFPPTSHSGCGPFESIEGGAGDWKLITGDVVRDGQQKAAGVVPRYVSGAEAEHVGVAVDRVGIFVRGRPGDRAVFYIDDIRLEGRIPEADAHTAAIEQRWEQFTEDWDARLAEWRRRLAQANEQMQDVPELPPTVQPAAESARVALQRSGEAIEEFARQGYAHPSRVDQLESDLRMAQLAPLTVTHLAQAQQRGEMVAAFAVPAITNARIIPTEAVVPGEPGAPLQIAAARGEYESASFVVMPMADVEDLLVRAADLTGDDGTIPAANIDVKAVKVWYQAGRTITDLRNKQLTPELLVNDPDLVRVNYEEEQNYLRSTAPDGTESYVLASGPTSEALEGVRPIDADTLQPMDLPALRLQQYWVTVLVPEDAVAGDYAGDLTISSSGNPDVTVPLQLSVHDFDLEDTPLIYSVYYRARLNEANEPTITSEGRSEEQYLAEMLDMKAHGVLYPTIYQNYHEQLLPRALEIREQAGLPTEHMFSLGTSTGSPQDEAAVQALRERVRQWVAMGERFGYDAVYIYGIDEAKGERLAAQQAAWRAVQEEGAKTFVACYYGTFEAMGDLLDLAVLAGRPDPEEAAKFHEVGSRVFTYAYPQVGPEEPETFRRNYGLVLWQANFDGAMDYAYQHGFGHVWNDFDSDRYRDHNFAYPTVNGVVSTIQFAGFREAVDDTRYMATLLAAIDACENAQAKAAAQQWVDTLDPQRDLHEVRAEMVEHINACSVR